MQITLNGNTHTVQDGATALQILAQAGFPAGHHLGVELPDGSLMHIGDNEVVKPSPDDRFRAVPSATKGRAAQEG